MRNLLAHTKDLHFQIDQLLNVAFSAIAFHRPSSMRIQLIEVLAGKRLLESISQIPEIILDLPAYRIQLSQPRTQGLRIVINRVKPSW